MEVVMKRKVYTVLFTSIFLATSFHLYTMQNESNIYHFDTLPVEIKLQVFKYLQNNMSADDLIKQFIVDNDQIDRALVNVLLVNKSNNKLLKSVKNSNYGLINDLTRLNNDDKLCEFKKNFINFFKAEDGCKKKYTYSELLTKDRSLSSKLNELLIESSKMSLFSISLYLINSGADDTARDPLTGKTPIHYLCNDKHITLEKIKYALKNGMRLYSQDNCKETVVHRICENDNLTFDIVKYFHEEKGLPLSGKGFQGLTPLHYFCKNKKITLELVEYFTKNSVDFNAKDFGRNIPLDYLCANSSVTLPMIECFVKGGGTANLNAVSKYGGTPLCSLCVNENVTLEMIKYFVKNNANPNIVADFNQSPLHFLCNNKNVTLEMVKCLVENGADIFAKDKAFGDTPLHSICKNKNGESSKIIEYLLLKGASPNVANNDRKRPFDYCQS